jgi:hypothetical protein
MARPARRQVTVGFTGTGTSITLNSFALAFDTTSIIFCQIRLSGSTDKVTAVDDGGGHAYTLITKALMPGGNWHYVYSVRNDGSPTVGQGVIVTLGSSGTIRGQCFEYNGCHATDEFDVVTDEDTFTATMTPVTGSIATTFTDETLLAFIATDQVVQFTEGGGFSEYQEYNDRIQMEDRDASTGGSYAAAWTLTASSTGHFLLLGLKSSTSSAVSAAGTAPRAVYMMG